MTSHRDLGVNDVGTQLFGPERLADLDLSVHTISVALRKADAATNAGSDLDPPIMEGLNRWGLTTRYLREALVAAQWSFDNPRNLARTIHPSGDFAVVVTTGDESSASATVTAPAMRAMTQVSRLTMCSTRAVGTPTNRTPTVLPAVSLIG